MGLVDKGVLCPCTRRPAFAANLTISTFPSSQYYQWKNKEIPQDPPASAGSREGSFSGASSRDRLSSLDFKYETAVSKCDATRLKIESMIMDFIMHVHLILTLSRFQSHELDRLTRLKSDVGDISAFFANLSPRLAKCSENVDLHLETLDPLRQIHLIVERDRTGCQRYFHTHSPYPRIPPLVYKNFYKSLGGRLFGVGLTSLHEITNQNYPSFFTRAIKLLEEECIDASASCDAKPWSILTSGLLNCHGVHALRLELERVMSSGGKGFTRVLKKYAS